MADKDEGLEFEPAREGKPTGETHNMTPEERKARGRRNTAIALGVVAFVLLIYLTTILRMSQAVSGAS